jgi:hypothetical protein
MSRKSMAVLRSEAAAKFPDNVAEQISPADLRSWVLDAVDTFSPGYGILDLSTPPVVQSLTTVAAVITVFDAVFLETEPFTVDTVAGTITAQVPIVADVSFDGSVEFAGNREVTIEMYLDEILLPYSAVVDGEGPGNPLALSVDGIVEMAAGQAVTIRGRANDATDVSFNRVILTARAVPLRD